MLKVLFKTDFYILIGNDANRAVDGVELRYEYSEEENPRVPIDISKPCSLLEMLIALARRMDYELSTDDYDRTPYYFWQMIRNLGLIDCDDDTYGTVRGTGDKIKDTIKRLLDRDYHYSGEGGLFPLKYPNRDQRDVEIWYQMHAYLYENYED